MNIIFKEKRLKKIFSKVKIKDKRQELIKVFGEKQAKAIDRRLQQLSSLNDFNDYNKIPGNIHQLEGNLKNSFACSITANFRIIFDVADSNGNLPLTEQKEIDFYQITTIIITDIEDYH